MARNQNNVVISMASDWMTPEQDHQWRLSLEVRLRRAHGDGLQDFFSTVMERRFKSDFVRVRPMGRLGDKGCDGYLQSTGQLYQCYGKVGDAALNVGTATAKMVDDYDKAATHFKDIMKEWHFVHNLIDGVPSEMILTLGSLKSKNGSCKVGLAGPEWFADTIFNLDEANVVDVLGPAATADQTYGLDLEMVRELLEAMTENIHTTPIDEGDPRPVPVDKLKFNKLSSHWQYLIRAGSPNAPHVQKYFDRHRDPEFGKLVAKTFKEKYTTLKLQGLPPDAIMAELYTQTAGNGIVSAMRQVATQAVLAYVFDSCDIFEDRSQAVPTQ